MSRISLGTNVYALNTQRKLAEGTAALERTFERLSSGQRINRASDDAAGLSVASSLNTNKRVYAQGIRNANDGISLLNIADGALQQLSDLTTRQIELASQAASGTFSFKQRQTMHIEAKALTDEFNRLISSTKFNGTSLLDASAVNALRLQFGFGNNGGASFDRNRELKRLVGDGTFSDADISGALSPSEAVDVNGDGIIDLVSASGISLGTGGGNFAAEYKPWTSASAVAVGDVNGDGRTDIVIVNSDSVESYLSDGNGAFSKSADVSVSGSFTNSSLELGDLNGDGKLDVAFNTPIGGQPGVKTLLGNGSGGFAGPVSTGISSTSFQLADFDRDGKSDLVTTGGSSVRLYRSDGTGSFTAAQTLLSGTFTTLVGDFDNDGYIDIVASGSSTNLLKNLGGTSFNTTTLSNVSSILNAVDINGDGYLDLLGESGGTLSTYFSNGNGTFQSGITSTVQDFGSGISIIAADFNNDGVIDIYDTDNGSGISQLYYGGGAFTSSAAQIDLTTVDSARSALTSLRAQLQRISSERGSLGAFQSRLSTSIGVLGAIVLNSEAARGRIVDADVAQESAALTRQQISQQTAAAVLAQANQAPALALKLLQNA